MPNRLFQGIVNQMREAIDRNIGVVDETGTVKVNSAGGDSHFNNQGSRICYTDS